MAPSNRRNGNKRNFEVPKFANSNNSRINLNDYEEVEDEYGFKYMRKKQKILLSADSCYYKRTETETETETEGENETEGEGEDEVMSTPVPTVSTNKLVTLVQTKHRINEAFSPSTPTPSKQILENNRKKRRSSFAVVDSYAGSNSHSTATVTVATTTATAITNILPPDNVKTFEYHRHIETDLPGPIKMRQLMIWACKKAARVDVERITSQKLVDGLVSNEITTSWYQRPNNQVIDKAIIYHLPNPQNQELSECIELYQSYHQKLLKECDTWEMLKSKTPDSFNLPSETLTKIDNSLNVLFAEEFQNMNKWLHSLPLSIDRFDWNTKLALSFQDHAKQFCEGVFHQIFAKFFSSDLPRVGKNHQRIEPMMLLRALSTNQSITH